MPENVRRVAWLALIASLPFEPRAELFGTSLLQALAAVVLITSIPAVTEASRRLRRHPLVLTAAVFIIVQWIAALLAPEFQANALKQAVRYTIGFGLMVAAASSRDDMFRWWAPAAVLAAAYGLIDHAGYGASWLFRSEEFYLGHYRRLSGSFEYPTTAAAYFAISLPIVWIRYRGFRGFVAAGLVWSALVMTFSRGGLVAAFAGVVVMAVVPLLRPGSGAHNLWPRPLALGGLGVGAYVVLAWANPLLAERAGSIELGNPFGAKYATGYNRLEQMPGVLDAVPLTITNTGTAEWPSSGRRRMGVAYRWLDLNRMAFVPGVPVETPLPRSVAPGEAVDLGAVGFRTPDSPGHYALALELYERRLDWLSRTGVIPALIEARIGSSQPRSTSTVDLTHLYRMGQDGPVALRADVQRSSLWRAALDVALAHPLLGAGPDNFRLVYGRYLGVSRWDEAIHANNLWLEVLSGSGILGLCALVAVLWTIPWRVSEAVVPLGIHLIHGVVDVFLVTTPVYFGFWILVGRVTSEEPV